MKVTVSEPAPLSQAVARIKLSSQTLEAVLFSLILMVGLVSRFYELGTRVMSHDETQHTYFSWLLYQGGGYQHTPLTHGPLQFHLIALSYAVFGDTDTAARIPHALAGVAAIAVLWLYRRYSGRSGMLVTAFLLLISPYILYYSRYARNESFVVLFGLVTIWALLRYLDSGQPRYLLWLTLATVLHFTAKETAFIYTAQVLFFSGLLWLSTITRKPWQNSTYRTAFILLLILAAILIGLALGVAAFEQPVEGQVSATASLSRLAGGLGLLAGLLSVYFLLRGYSSETLRQERTFDIMILLTTLVLPQLAPFPMVLAGLDPLDYSWAGIVRGLVFVLPLFAISIAIGIWWNSRVWGRAAAIFHGIFFLLYTTLFSNLNGVAGVVSSLGYWLEQQGVARGSQPWYYYLAIQVPIYEYLPLFGSILAGIVFLRLRRKPAVHQEEPGDLPAAEAHSASPFIPLLIIWTLTSFLAYTVAGEKMPWLTVHIALPMILLAGWALGQFIDQIDWRSAFSWRTVLIFTLIPLIALAVSELRNYLPRIIDPAAVTPPVDPPGLLATLVFLAAAIYILVMQISEFTPAQFARLAVLAGFAYLAVMTARTAYTAAFIHYDQANEFLVYAHSAPANKRVWEQAVDISTRLYGDLSLKIAYDNSDGAGDPAAAWPTAWYYRNFPNARSYGPDVPADILDYPVIITSDNNWSKVEPVLRNRYESFEYIRMWWPTQDYFNLTWERIQSTFTNPEMRSAIYQIWRDRDFSSYAQLTQKDFSLPNWSPARRMRVYIRKDLNAMLWSYGSIATAPVSTGDPYSEKMIDLQALRSIGGTGTAPGMFQTPRGVEVAPDGSIYVADTNNHRIQHFSSTGELLNSWGAFGASETGEASPGNFNEPWAVAVAPDGSVYVADTWNHRIQMFTASGDYVTGWGYFGTAEAPDAFWGPRDVLVDSLGRVFVTDTGNKRVVIFDRSGSYLGQIYSQFNEPVGLAMAPDGTLFVADTWNQRITVFQEIQPGDFQLTSEWDVDAWFGESLDNKPYLAVTSSGTLVVSEPEGFRVLEFSLGGDFIRTWGDFGDDLGSFTLLNGLAADQENGIWVADSGNDRLLYFSLANLAGQE